MPITLKKAQRGNQRLKMTLMGATGAGKTYTSLQIASALGGEILHIDTETSSATMYAPRVGENPDPSRGRFDFNHYDWTLEEGSRFNPNRLIEIIKEVGPQVDTIIIDSASHFWESTGGIQDMVSASKMQGPAAWGKIAKPVLTDLFNTILTVDAHVIFCMRSKLEFDTSKDEKTGKVKWDVLGVAPAFKADVIYEVGLAASIDREHNLEIIKSRYDPIEVNTRYRTTEFNELFGQVVDWLGTSEGQIAQQIVVDDLEKALSNDGDAPDPVSADQLAKFMAIFGEVEDDSKRSDVKKSFVDLYKGPPDEVLHADNYEKATKEVRELVDSANKS